MRECDVIKNSLNKLLKMKKKELSYLAEVKGKGWEKWLQMELGYELNKSQAADVKFEVPYPYDKKKKITSGKKKNTNGFIDLQYRRKNLKKDLFTAVEIKMSGSPTGIRAALADLAKIKAFRSAHWDFRAIYSIVFIKKNDSQRNTKYHRLIETLVKNGDVVKSEITKWPGFRVLIIGWEAPPNKSSNPDEFKKWVSSTLKLYKDLAPKLSSPRIN